MSNNKVECDGCYDVFKECLDDIESLIDMAIWMSGSQDFAPSGTAYHGWIKMSLTLKNIMARHKVAKCMSCKYGMLEHSVDRKENLYYCNNPKSLHYNKPMKIVDSCDKWEAQ